MTEMTLFGTAELSDMLYGVADVADAAGRTIMQIYEADFSVTLKSDRSPLTEADLAAQALITAGLHALRPDIPLLGEESPEQVLVERHAWRTLWLVDPLDGTREFVKRNGEFTVNIALIHEGEPILGVVYAPARGVLYAGARGCGAFRRAAHAQHVPIHVQSSAAHPLRVLGSRSHGDALLDRALARLGQQERISIGSAIKFGLLAEGSGDLYVRRGATSEWDTAAGQAIVLEAGGCVTDLQGQPLRYNQRPTVINPSFMAFGDSSRDWAAMLVGI